MGKGIGYGKVIIFGEHFVVHGAPAIAGGISNMAVVEVKQAERNSIVTDALVIPELSVSAIDAVLKSMGIMERYEVRLTGDLPTYGGLGSSAAFCVGLVRSLADDRGTHLTNAEVNRYAYDGEKAFHGDPSGIDNTLATHGGIVEFHRGKTPAESRFDFIETKKPLDMVVSFSGRYGPTAKMIERVRKFKEEDEGEFSQLMDEYNKIAEDGRKSIEKGSMERIGELMNQNQELLSDLGVSDETNDRVNELALKAGALGAKVTGGGGGGCCIALGRDGRHCQEIARVLDSEGYRSFFTSVGRERQR